MIVPLLFCLVFASSVFHVIFSFSILVSVALAALSVGLAAVRCAGLLLIRRTLIQRLPSIKMTRRIRKLFRRGALAAFIVTLIFKIFSFINYYPRGDQILAEQEREDLLHRRAFLVSSVSDPDFGLGDMPSFMPATFRKEWAIGTLSMTAAALVNIAYEIPSTREESLRIVSLAIKRMLRDDIRSFEIDYWGKDALDNLDSNDGQIGYLGHLNFMFGAYRMLGGDTTFEELHLRVSAALARRIRASHSTYLETFPEMIFVPDNMVVFASLALASKIYNLDFDDIFRRWHHYTRNNLIDPKTKLIVTWLTPDGRGWGVGRGSYAGWNSFYMPFFDTAFASEQFQRLKASMVSDLPFSAKGILEYPRGVDGSGDVDSGPVVFGLSTSGTGFALAGARHAHDAELFQGLLITAETVGTSIEIGGRRRYLLAPLVGDAIMLAMKTARVWDGRYLHSVREASG